MFKHLVPKSKMAATSRRIMTDRIIGICNPVSCRRNIDVECGARGFYEDCEIVANEIPSFDTVLHEIRVTCGK